MADPQEDIDEVSGTPSVRRETEISGVAQNEINIPPEAAPWIKENPNPEAGWPVEIAKGEIQTPLQSKVPGAVAKSQVEEISKSVTSIPTPPDALQVVRGENILTSPDGNIGISTVVVHQDRRSKYRRSKGLDALPKAA